MRLPFLLGAAHRCCIFLLAAVTAMAISEPALPQSVPLSPNAPWRANQETSLVRDAGQIGTGEFTVNSATTYSLAELIDLAEAHNPNTRLAWQRALARADALGVARSELFPTVAAVALSETARDQEYLNTRYYRQTAQSFDGALDLSYTIFDFGARRGRIDAAKAQLLAADFAFNDVHRRLIFAVAQAYYDLLNAVGQEAAARASLANAEAVQEAAEASLKNGLATLPDVLEARSATARAGYDLQAALGAEDVAHGNLATALGASPLSTIRVEPIEQIAIQDPFEVTVDQAIDRALAQRPDLMERVARIRAATARLKEARAAWFPVLRTNIEPDPEFLYAMQQTLPWGHTADLDGQISFHLGWTIFDGGARRHRVAQAGHDLQAAQADAAAARDAVENGAWTAYSNLKTALRQREAAQALLVSAEQSYNAALESYHDGVRSLLDVTEAQRVLAEARSTDVLARTQVLTSLAALASETGDSLRPGAAGAHP